VTYVWIQKPLVKLPDLIIIHREVRSQIIGYLIRNLIDYRNALEVAEDVFSLLWPFPEERQTVVGRHFVVKPIQQEVKNRTVELFLVRIDHVSLYRLANRFAVYFLTREPEKNIIIWATIIYLNSILFSQTSFDRFNYPLGGIDPRRRDQGPDLVQKCAA